MNAPASLQDAIAAVGYELPPDIVFDGKLYRFATNADKRYSKDGWYVAFDDDRGRAAAFGSWRDGASHTWSDGTSRELSPADLADIERKKKTALAREKQARDQAALRAERIYEQATEASASHPYLKRKGIQPPQGARQIRGLTSTAFGFQGKEWTVNALIVPMRDNKGAIRSLQLVPDDPSKRKLFLKGGQTAATFHALGELEEAERILLAEGLATAQSLREATGLAVVTAFSAGNLPAVAAIVRSKNALAEIIVCADDDEAGRRYAKLAENTGNGRIVFPGDGFNDFNDLHAAKGLEAVKRSVLGEASEESEANEDWRSELIVKHKDDGTQTIPCRVHNLILILENGPEFRGRIQYNQFAERVTIDGEDADDIGPILLKAVLEKKWIQEKVTTADVKEAVSVVADRQPFHPVLEYLDKLTWDGIKRIDDFFPDVLGTPKDAYHMGVANTLFVSAVARVRQPGCKADHITILISPQGFGKTKLWKVLFMDWTAEIIANLSEKDFFAGLRGLWAADFGELDAFTKAEESRIKLVLSQQTDHYRAVWKSAHKHYKRQNIWVGGTNNEHYSKDPTGDRRSLPVKVHQKIDHEFVASMRDQLWAEACVRYEQGVQWWNVPDAEKHQAEIYIGDTWEEIIARWLEDRRAATPPFEDFEVTIAEVLDKALKIDPGRQARPDQNRASASLRRLGWSSRRETVNGARVAVYRPP